MNPDQRSASTGKATERDKSGPASRPSGTRQTLREIRDDIVVMWWRFFDWLAVVSWKKLLLVSLLALILGGIFKQDGPVFALIVVSFIIKAVAGGQPRGGTNAQPGPHRGGNRKPR